MLFKKAAVFADLHLGKRSDSPVHNQDCYDFAVWFCDQAKKANVDAIIMLGDWFDNRSRIRLDTLAMGNKIMRMLREVAPVHMFTGNHDMFHRDNRSITSIDGYDEWENVHVYNDPTVVKGVGFVPYLVGTEYVDVMHMEAKYLFGHFELPTFLMNSTVEMPDKGQFNSDGFTNPDYVFTGHFHQRQVKVNTSKIPVWYIGSPFGHDFNDVNDKSRGMMLLEWDGEPEFIDYPDGPLYQRFKISEIMDLMEQGSLENLVRPTSVLEIKDDVGIELEDISLIRQELNTIVRETRVVQRSSAVLEGSDVEIEDIDSKSLDDVIAEHLSKIVVMDDSIDPDYLIKLYKGDE